MLACLPINTYLFRGCLELFFKKGFKAKKNSWKLVYFFLFCYIIFFWAYIKTHHSISPSVKGILFNLKLCEPWFCIWQFAYCSLLPSNWKFVKNLFINWNLTIINQSIWNGDWKFTVGIWINPSVVFRSWPSYNLDLCNSDPY